MSPKKVIIIDVVFPEVMTEQDIFNHVAPFLLKQGRRSETVYNYSTACAYRNGEGQACAAGCLLTDEEANFIKATGYNFKKFSALPQDLIPPRLRNHIEFINNLQRIHDVHDVSKWKNVLLTFAKANAIDATIISNDNSPKEI